MTVNILDLKKDERGVLAEIFKFPNDGQVLFSTTKPGIKRGNHYHNRKIEKFCVIEGEARLLLKDRAAGEVKSYELSGDRPTVVDIPVNQIHNITNIGEEEMFLLIWVSEIFNPDDPDTFYEEI